MNTIQVCPSPELLPLYDIQNKIIVVTDILRATSTMVTALAHHFDEIVPVSNIDECILYKEKGYLIAAERGGAKVDGFDLGNSPLSYTKKYNYSKLALTTSNGTKAIHASQKSKEIIIGAFLNISKVIDYLIRQEEEVLVLCSGWKGKCNLEDTLFAGAIVEGAKEKLDWQGDFTLISNMLYQKYKHDLPSILPLCSHYRRLVNLGVREDLEFSFQIDKYPILPICKNGVITAVKEKV